MGSNATIPCDHNTRVGEVRSYPNAKATVNAPSAFFPSCCGIGPFDEWVDKHNTKTQYCMNNIEVINTVNTVNTVNAGRPEAVDVMGHSVEFAENKTGGGIVLVSKKALGERLNIKGAALKRAHYEYRLAAGRVLNARLGAKLASGVEMVQSSIPTKKGWVHKTVLAVNVLPPSSGKRKNEELSAKVAALRAGGASADQILMALGL